MTTPTSGSTSFQLSEADVVASVQAHLRIQTIHPKNPWINRVLIVMVLLLLVLAGGLAALGDWAGLARIGLIAAGFVALATVVYRWVVPWQTKRQFQAVPAYSRETQFSWDAGGFHVRTERDTVDLPWTEITDARKTAEYVLLYRGTQMFHAIPARALADGEAGGIIAAATATAHGDTQPTN